MKGAVSLELIILLVIVVAIVAVFGNMILDTSLNATSQIADKTNKVMEKVANTCVDDSDCPESAPNCVDYKCTP